MDDYEIFISYNRKDRKLVKKLIKALEDNGNWRIFRDEVAIEPGERWDSKLESMLESVLCVLVLWTENSKEREWVCNEASEAIKLDKYFPVCLGDIEQPPLEYRKRQTLQLGHWVGDTDSDHFRSLVASLDRYIENRRPKKQDSKTEGGTGLERVLARTVNRFDQIGALDSKLNPESDSSGHQCWLFQCKPDDWLDAFADHLVFRHKVTSLFNSGSSFTDMQAIRLAMVGFNARAFEGSLAQQIPAFVVDGKLNIESWLASGDDEKVIYVSLTLGKDSKAEEKIQRIKTFLQSTPPISKGRLIVLIACFTTNAGWFTKWKVKGLIKGVKKLGVNELQPLDLISDEETEQWVDGFVPPIRERYNCETIKKALYTRLQGGKEEHYRDLQNDIQNALRWSNRCDQPS